MSDFVQPLAQSNYELIPLPGAFITDGRFVRYENDKNISDTVKGFDGKISSATEAAEEASDKADALDVRVTALENKPSGDDYTPLKNKPKINGVELSGNKTAEDLGLYSKPSGGIPKSDLAESVQQEISGKIDSPQVAAVGQVLAVKAVDEDGKPTEWEVVDAGGGGGDISGVVFLKNMKSPVRSPYGMVALDGEIHVLGYDESERLAYYKWDRKKWTFVSTAPYRLSYNNTVILNNEIHILGGAYGKRNHYKWNGTEWINVSTLPYDFNDGSAVVLNNEIYIMGGEGNYYYVYKWNGKSWSYLNNIPYPFTGGGAVVIDGEIHIFGSSYNNTYYTRHYKLNSAGSWVNVDTLPMNYYNGTAVVVLDNELYMFGGYNGPKKFFKYNGSSWVSPSNLPSDYSGKQYGAVVLNDRIFTIYNSIISVYSVSDGAWSIQEIAIRSL